MQSLLPKKKLELVPTAEAEDIKKQLLEAGATVDVGMTTGCLLGVGAGAEGLLAADSRATMSASASASATSGPAAQPSPGRR